VLQTDLDRLATLDRPAADAHLLAMHRRYHDRPLDHVRVHLAWMRVHFARREYLRGLGHAFAGLVVAGPASLVQRYTGLVVPAFDQARVTNEEPTRRA
jgi:hypothetical protein